MPLFEVAQPPGFGSADPGWNVMQITLAISVDAPRSRLVQFDTHRTRQIAAENGGLPGHCSNGSFSVTSDLLPDLLSDQSQRLVKGPENSHSEIAPPCVGSNPHLTGKDTSRVP